MQKPLKVLFVAIEAEPFVKTESLARIATNLPKSMKVMGHEIRVILPGYNFINERRFHIHNLLRMKDIKIPVGEIYQEAHLKSSYINCENTKVQVYFLSNNQYFKCQEGYFQPEIKKYFHDNDECFIFFCRGVLETLKKLCWQPHIIHCNDWQCGLIPAYLKTIYKKDPFFKNTKTVFTTYNSTLEGISPQSSFEKTGLPAEIFNNNKQGGKLDFLTVGTAFADVVTILNTRANKKLTIDKFNSYITSNWKKKQVIPMNISSQDNNRQDILAEKFVSLYRELMKNG